MSAFRFPSFPKRPASLIPLFALGALCLAPGAVSQDAPAAPATPAQSGDEPLISPEDTAGQKNPVPLTGLSVDLAPDPFTPSVRVYLVNHDKKPAAVRITLANDENFLGVPKRVQTATVPANGKLQVRFLLPGAAMAPDSRYAFTAEVEMLPSAQAANPTDDTGTPAPAPQEVVVVNPVPPKNVDPNTTTVTTGDTPPETLFNDLPLAGGGLTTRIKTTRMLSFFQIERTGSAPTFDGSMNGWLNASMIVVSVPGRARGAAKGWTGNSDKTSSARFLWDAKNLYVMVRCTDDVTHFASSADDANGDRIRVALSPTASHLLDAPWVEMDVVPLESGTVIATRKSSANLKLKPGRVTTVRGAYSKQNGVDVFQAAIPWKELGIAQGKTTLPLGLTVRALDDDGDGIKSWLDWGGGAGVPADPPSFSDVALGS